MNKIICVKCRKYACAYFLAGLTGLALYNGVSPPPAHAVGTMMTTGLATGTTSGNEISISTISGSPIGVIYDQVIGTPRTFVRQDKQRVQAAPLPLSSKIGSTVRAGHPPPRTV